MLLNEALGLHICRFGVSAVSVLAMLAIAGCGNPHSTVMCVAVNWAHASPRQVDEQIAFPLESHINGLPGVEAITSFSRLGRVEIYVQLNSHGSSESLRQRVGEVASLLPAGSESPTIDSVPDAPIPALEADDATVVEIRPDLEKIKELGVSEATLGKVIAAAPTPGDNLDEFVKRLRDLSIRSNESGPAVRLQEIAEIEMIRQPRCIIRQNGFRLSPPRNEE